MHAILNASVSPAGDGDPASFELSIFFLMFLSINCFSTIFFSFYWPKITKALLKGTLFYISSTV